MANRKTPAPSNTAGTISGVAALEDINDEISALWQYVQVPLSNVAGTANAITADCDVALDLNKKGQKFTLTPTLTNTAAGTLSVNNKPALALKNRDGSAIVANRLAAGRTEIIENDGVNYRLMNDAPAVVGGSLRSIFAYQLANNVNGQAYPVGWSKYPLNTLVINEITGLTFNGALNQLTLPARTYEIDAFMATYYRGTAFALYSVSDGQVISGTVNSSPANNSGPTRLVGKFTLTAPKVVELRLHNNPTVGAAGVTGLGQASFSSAPALPEQYGFLDLRSG